MENTSHSDEIFLFFQALIHLSHGAEGDPI